MKRSSIPNQKYFEEIADKNYRKAIKNLLLWIKIIFKKKFPEAKFGKFKYHSPNSSSASQFLTLYGVTYRVIIKDGTLSLAVQSDEEESLIIKPCATKKKFKKMLKILVST